ncbi:GNAT family N-acetyltransferase [Staphylococcus edaphicus]|uniref:GNAT family N-acetyltransferase n=1 Tax=Staphylococcus edaphicus TaxID=1955013 RepID=A0A2C6WN60_9STAP|nr:N-acetyltransferase [Staphylococcus edaphicus]PHK49573.1 GNAT family N-acetyltransferase [Staphylococcus edaphicus]UQW82005.1 GNAT family N-acetyltransferase [Staphylococcus edaphicus]
MEFTIRALTEEDRHGKANVHYESWLSTYNHISVNDFLENLNKAQFIEKSSLHNLPTLVATVKNEIVGFITYGKTASMSTSDDWSEIYALYLLEAYQRHMIGYALTQRALELSYPDNVTLWVVEENTNAIHFYEQIGFNKTEEKKPTYFGKTYNEIRMNFTRTEHDN